MLKTNNIKLHKLFFTKEWILLKYWLILFWIISGLNALPSIHDFFTEQLNSYWIIIYFILLLIIQTKIIQSDPIIGSTQFFISKPISKSFLLMNKLLIWFAFVLLPALISNFIFIYLLNIKLLVLDYFLIYWRMFFLYFTILSIGLILAMFTKNISSTMFLSTGILLCYYLIYYLISKAGFSHNYYFKEYTLRLSMDTIVQFIFIFCLFFAMISFYKHKNWLSGVPLVAFILLMLLIRFLWPFDFMKSIHAYYIKKDNLNNSSFYDFDKRKTLKYTLGYFKIVNNNSKKDIGINESYSLFSQDAAEVKIKYKIININHMFFYFNYYYYTSGAWDIRNDQAILFNAKTKQYLKSSINPIFHNCPSLDYSLNTILYTFQYINNKNITINKDWINDSAIYVINPNSAIPEDLKGYAKLTIF